MPGAAFFDLDKTLMAGSSGMVFARVANRVGFVPRRQLAKWGWDHLRYRLRGSSDEQTNAVLTSAKRVFAEIPERDVERMAPEVLAGILPRSTRRCSTRSTATRTRAAPPSSSARPATTWSRRSPRCSAWRAAIGTRWEVGADGKYTGEMDGPFVYGEGKVEAMRALRQESTTSTWTPPTPTPTRSATCRCSAPSATPWWSTPTPTCSRSPAEEGWRVMRFEKLGRKLAIAGATVLAAAGGSRRPGLQASPQRPARRGLQLRAPLIQLLISIGCSHVRDSWGSSAWSAGNARRQARDRRAVPKRQAGESRAGKANGGKSDPDLTRLAEAADDDGVPQRPTRAAPTRTRRPPTQISPPPTWTRSFRPVTSRPPIETSWRRTAIRLYPTGSCRSIPGRLHRRSTTRASPSARRGRRTGRRRPRLARPPPSAAPARRPSATRPPPAATRRRGLLTVRPIGATGRRRRSRGRSRLGAPRRAPPWSSRHRAAPEPPRTARGRRRTAHTPPRPRAGGEGARADPRGASSRPSSTSSPAPCRRGAGDVALRTEIERARRNSGQPGAGVRRCRLAPGDRQPPGPRGGGHCSERVVSAIRSKFAHMSRSSGLAATSSFARCQSRSRQVKSASARPGMAIGALVTAAAFPSGWRSCAPTTP